VRLWFAGCGLGRSIHEFIVADIGTARYPILARNSDYF
jgi:hypothetical protein